MHKKHTSINTGGYYSVTKYSTCLLVRMMEVIIILFCVVIPLLLYTLRCKKQLSLFKLGFQESHSGWLLLSANYTTFSAARVLCFNLGSHLAEIKTNKDHVEVTQQLSGLKPSQWWVGATDSQNEGVFRWLSDNTTMTNETNYWAAGQPDNWPNQGPQRQEDCVVYTWDLDGDKKWKWNDLNCNSKAHFICRIK